MCGAPIFVVSLRFFGGGVLRIWSYLVMVVVDDSCPSSTAPPLLRGFFVFFS